MSEALPEFRFFRPQSLDQAIAALHSQPGARLCAGGTDLIVNMRRGLVEVETLVDISGIAELKTLELDKTGLRIGAGVTLRDLTQHPGLNGPYQAIAEAARAIAGPGHREAATLGGNLCLDTRCLYYNQSHWWRKSNDYCLKYRGDICHVAPKGNRCRAAFSGDMAPALMVLDAEVDIIGPDGTRRLPLAELYREDGIDYLTLRPGEILSTVYVPAQKNASTYGKVRVRGAIDFPLAGVAVACQALPEGAHRFKLAITGTNSMPLNVDIPAPLGQDEAPDPYFATLEKLVQKAVSPQRTSTTAPHYRRLSVSALASRLARAMI
jgi:4-hydroxybenzoyl-CoA reductase subunit beta